MPTRCGRRWSEFAVTSAPARNTINIATGLPQALGEIEDDILRLPAGWPFGPNAGSVEPRLAPTPTAPDQRDRELAIESNIVL